MHNGMYLLTNSYYRLWILPRYNIHRAPVIPIVKLK
jgi:hypothetical protein